MKLWLDFETYSETPIKAGTYRYIADCEILIATWAIDNGEVHCLDYTEVGADASELIAAIESADEIWAHNAMFDRNVAGKLTPTPLTKWRCTMVKAMSHALPGSLDALCEILGVPTDKAKHKRGKDLIKLFCKPRPKNTKLRRATRDTHPSDWAEFIEYAKADIDAMREVDTRLPIWNYRANDIVLWHLDQTINDRGFAVDVELAEAAVRATDKEQEALAAQTFDATSGEVARATQRDAMLEHILTEYGIALDDMKGSTLERKLDDPVIPEGLKDLLRLRLQASTTSTSKYTRILQGHTQRRMRGTLQFAGAGRTRRWAGRTFQPQNLPRPTMPAESVEQGIDTLKADCADLIYPNVMQLTSSALRGLIVAPEGKKLVIADLSNIEGRVLAWLADERWKIQAFRDFDAGVGHDMYNLAYANSFRVSPESVTKKQRQVGKVQELALGYAGGVGAFLTFAAAYSIDLEAMANEAWASIPDNIKREATEFYKWMVKQKNNTYGLSERAFVVCDSFKRLWRYSNPSIESLWHDLHSACVFATLNPSRTVETRKFKVRRDGAWLRVGLPSGNCLCYPNPIAVEKGHKHELSYMGVHQFSRKWVRINTTGGKLVENATQAMARDVLASSMQPAEDAGYPIVLSVHDELLTETPDTDQFTVAGLSRIMATTPHWAEGLPLAAAGFETYRYRKD